MSLVIDNSGIELREWPEVLLVFYFIELSSMGTGMPADQSVGCPIYPNGFTASVGIRVYF